MKRIDLAVIGASLGGLDAITRVLLPLPKPLPITIAIVQHRADVGRTLGEVLTARTGLPVADADDQSSLEPGRVLLAPANYHLLVDGETFELSVDPPVHAARPSIDVLFESVADSCAGRAMGILLTGMSADGAQGLARIAERGGITVVQDPAEAESPIAPNAALALMKPAHVLPVDRIGELLAEHCR